MDQNKVIDDEIITRRKIKKLLEKRYFRLGEFAELAQEYLQFLYIKYLKEKNPLYALAAFRYAAINSDSIPHWVSMYRDNPVLPGRKREEYINNLLNEERTWESEICRFYPESVQRLLSNLDHPQAQEAYKYLSRAANGDLDYRIYLYAIEQAYILHKFGVEHPRSEKSALQHARQAIFLERYLRKWTRDPKENDLFWYYYGSLPEENKSALIKDRKKWISDQAIINSIKIASTALREYAKHLKEKDIHGNQRRANTFLVPLNKRLGKNPNFTEYAIVYGLDKCLRHYLNGKPCHKAIGCLAEMVTNTHWDERKVKNRLAWIKKLKLKASDTKFYPKLDPP